MPVRVALAGDTMLGRGVAERLATDPGHELLAAELVAIVRETDLFVLNLGCWISDRGEPVRKPQQGYFFRAPPAAAQGLAELGVTSFVLADEGMTRERMSRSAAAARATGSTSQGASSASARNLRRPIPTRAIRFERLAERLQTSGAQILAIDSGRPNRESPDVAQTRHDLERATRERDRVEASRRRWVPGVLSRARGREAESRERLGQVERLAAERRHGARPFVTRGERDAQTAELTDRLAERAAQRERHERDLARGL